MGIYGFLMQPSIPIIQALFGDRTFEKQIFNDLLDKL